MIQICLLEHDDNVDFDHIKQLSYNNNYISIHHDERKKVFVFFFT